VKPKAVIVALLLIAASMMLQPTRSFSQQVPDYLRDRGTGMPTSILGTYVRKGELLIYPFYEYYRDNNMEYEPADFGFGSTQEFRGRYRAHEGLLFIGYGISDRVALEFEAAGIGAKFNKAATDFSPLPSMIKESGIGDVEAQIRWRWNNESANRPEFFSYFETVFPTAERYSLIGTNGWETKFGAGLIRGYRWGTITVRGAVEYKTAEKSFAVGEYAFEYQKRTSDNFRFYAMLEGSEYELTLVPGMEWHLGHGVFLKLNNGFGLTSKAIDFAPEVGVMFSLSRRRN